MTNSPLRQLILVAAAILLAGLWVWFLTVRSDTTPLATSAPVAAAKSTLPLQLLVTATSPCAVTISSANTTVLTAPSLTTELRANTAAPRGQPLDLIVKATWPTPSASNALRVRILSDGDTLADHTFWADPQVDDVLTLPPPPQP